MTTRELQRLGRGHGAAAAVRDPSPERHEKMPRQPVAG